MRRRCPSLLGVRRSFPTCSRLQLSLKLLPCRLGVKCGIVGGAIYLTAKEGVWSPSTHDGAEVLKGFRETVIPATDNYIKQIPKVGQVQEAVKSQWNSGVQWTADGIANLPDYVYGGMKKGGNYVYQTLFPVTGDK